MYYQVTWIENGLKLSIKKLSYKAAEAFARNRQNAEIVPYIFLYRDN